MALQDAKRINLGTGNVEFGDYNNGVFDTYSDIGVIKGNLNITIENEILDFEAGRPLEVLLQAKIRERVTIAGTMAELKLATLKQALGSGSITSSVPVFLDGTSSALKGTLETGKVIMGSSTILTFGGSPTHNYIGIRFTHVGADGKRSVFEGFKASPTGRLALPFNETDWNLTEFEFRLLADTSRPAGAHYFQYATERLEA